LGCFPEAHGLDFFLFLALDVRTLGRACVSMFCVRERKRDERIMEGERMGGSREGWREGGGRKKRGESSCICMCVCLTHSRQHWRCWRPSKSCVCVCLYCLCVCAFTQRDVHIIQTHISYKLNNITRAHHMHTLHTSTSYAHTSYINIICTHFIHQHHMHTLHTSTSYAHTSYINIICTHFIHQHHMHTLHTSTSSI
jgi:hypothetical protein